MKLRLFALLFLSSAFLIGCGDQAAYYDEAPVVEKAEAPAKAAVTEPAKVEEPKVEAVKEEVVASGDSDGTHHVVKMLNSNHEGIMVFEPGFLQINIGDTVYFEATDAGHDAVSILTPGEAWRVGFTGGKVTFNDEGIHIYYCTPHKSMAMYGIIQVGEAVNKDEALVKVKEIEGTFAMNHGRLQGYADQIK